MPIIFKIAQMEFRIAWRQPGTKALWALFTFLMLVALCLSGQRQSHQRKEQARYQEMVREQWLQQPDRHPHRVAHFGNFAFKPKPLFAGFDPGVENYVGRIQYLEAHRQNPLNFAEASSLTSASRLGELSPSLVAGALMALVIVLLGHSMLANEHASGRYPLLVVQGVPSRDLWWGKVLGLALTVLPFSALAPAALGVSVFFSDPNALRDPALPLDLLLRGTLLMISFVLHSLVWILLTTLASSLARNRSQAAATLLALWILAAILIPRLSGGLANEAHPLPTRSHFMHALERDTEKLGDSHNEQDPTFRRLREETLRRHNVTSVEELPMNYRGIVMAKGEENSSLVYQKHTRHLENVMRQQEFLVRAWGWLSPVLCWQEVSMHCCGTDTNSTRLFCDQAERWRYEFVQKLNALQRDHVRYEHNSTQRIDRSHWQAFDDFSPKRPDFVDSFESSVPVLAKMITLCALLAIAGAAVSRRPLIR